MKLSLIISMLLLQIGLCSAQSVNTTYYADRSLTVPSTPRKALYSKTEITTPAGDKTIEVLQLKTRDTVSSAHYKGQEPIGKWIHTNTVGHKQVLNYDFQLSYSGQLCRDTTVFMDFKKVNVYPFTDSDSLGYLAPKFATGEKTMSIFVNKRIVYPSEALEWEVSGSVQVQLILGYDGEVEEIAITKRVNPILDKEAMRIVRTVRFQNGARLKGVKKKICAIVPITFVIEE